MEEQETVTITIGSSSSDMMYSDTEDTAYPPPFGGLDSERGGSARRIGKSETADQDGGSPSDPGWGPVVPSASLDVSKFTYNLGSIPEGAQITNVRLVVQHSGTSDDGVDFPRTSVLQNVAYDLIHDCVCGFFSGPNCGPEGPIPYQDFGYSEPPQLTTWGAEWSSTHNSYSEADYKSTIASNAVAGQPIGATQSEVDAREHWPANPDYWYVDILNWEGNVNLEDGFATLIFGMEQNPNTVNAGGWLNNITEAEVAVRRECDDTYNPPAGYPYSNPNWTFPYAAVRFYTFDGTSTWPRLEITYIPEPAEEEPLRYPIAADASLAMTVDAQAFVRPGPGQAGQERQQRTQRRRILEHRARQRRGW